VRMIRGDVGGGSAESTIPARPVPTRSSGGGRTSPVAAGGHNGGMLERLPERARTPAMARAMMAPSAILLAGAGTAAAILAGVPLAAAAAVGALAWAGKVALAIPRKDKRPDMNPATVRDPWRSLVRQALKAEARFNETVRQTRSGPLRDRLAEVSAQVSVAVDAS